MKYIKDTILFIQYFYKTQYFIPLHSPTFGGNEKKYLLETIDSTFVSSLGIYVDQFEEMMSSITNKKKSGALINGTAVIQVALRLVGVSTVDEVITQVPTFVASANAIAYHGAPPFFFDVELDTMGLSPNAISRFLEYLMIC
jgi:dTDP-4-amino-4,6-dideoxygalactose transaminase